MKMLNEWIGVFVLCAVVIGLAFVPWAPAPVEASTAPLALVQSMALGAGEDITSPQATDFTITLRRLMHRKRALNAEMESAKYAWTNGAMAAIPSDGGTIIDGHEGTHPLTGVQVHAIIDNLLAPDLAAYAAFGAAKVEAACIQTLIVVE